MNLFKVVATLGLDSSEYERGLEQAEQQTNFFAESLKSNLVAKGIEAAVSGLKKLAGVAVSTTKDAVGSFADYEQLTGGIETLFGTSAQRVMRDADAAFKTAGIDANKYMETAIQSAASLINSLEGDTDKAAELINMSIIDMSDNVNKMGTTMEAVQNAYRGFSRGNFTMLDNLALGFAGTKTGMEELLAKAQELSGVEYDISSYSDIVQAIHVVQTEMGITGTTAKEAEETISGSINQVKAAYENLKTLLASGNQNDIRKGVNTLVDTIKLSIKNALPKIKNAIKGLWTGIKTFLRENMPALANTIIPVIDNIANAVKGLFNFISDNGEIIISIIKGIVAAFLAFKVAGLIQSAVTALGKLVQLTNPVGLLVGVVGGLVGAFVALHDWANKLPEDEQKRRAAIEETTDKIKDQVEEWDNLKDSQEDLLRNKDSEFKYYEGLWGELKKITDENGKIKDGYEKRAEFISKQLSDAYGIEINIVDGVIQKYNELSSTFDDLAKKKRAEIILSSQEEMYKKALEERSQNEELLTTRQNELNDQLGKLYEAEKVLKEAKKDTNPYSMTIVNAQKAYNEELKRYQGMSKALAELKETVKDEYRAIGTYQSNYESFLSGNYDAIIVSTGKYVGSVKDYNKEQILSLKETYEYDKKLYNEMKKDAEKSGDEMLLQGLDTLAKEVNLYADRLSELRIFVDRVGEEYDRLDRIVSGNNGFYSAKGEAIGNILASGKELTSGSIKQEMLTDKGSGVTINVYGAEGQNVSELADAVSQRIVTRTRQERMAW